MAPDDASIELHAPDALDKNSSGLATAVLRLKAGDLLQDEANVSFGISRGRLAPLPPGGTCSTVPATAAPAINMLSTKGAGVAQACFASDEAGTITLIARSGSVADTVMVEIK